MKLPDTYHLIKGQIVVLDQYDYAQAIEYAREKLGLKWDDNRRRLSFYDLFYEYLQKKLDKINSPHNKGKLEGGGE